MRILAGEAVDAALAGFMFAWLPPSGGRLRETIKRFSGSHSLPAEA